MSATPTPTLEGTQAPSQVEMLWERWRSLAYTIVAAVIVALGVNYLLKHFKQKEVDANESWFATTLDLRAGYTDYDNLFRSVSEGLTAVDAKVLQDALAKATEAQKPFLLIAIARKAMYERQWDAAEKALHELETKYPEHSLVRSSAEPVQAREFEKIDPKGKKPAEPKPAVAGSSISMMRAQIEAAKAYVAPPQFAPVEIAADAPKVKVEFSGDYGHCVIALHASSPLHRDAFLALALQEGGSFWKDIAIDEIRRPSKGNKQPHELHLGFETTKDSDTDKWTTTDPSKHQVEFEKNGLSHFAGAVSADNAPDGKSCADRFWISVDDAPRNDGDRVVFGQVVEGLENLKRICEATMSAQDEERGQGRPSPPIRVTTVTVLQ
jgi:cyclophilin family peptidyl-prolyl cis-trans isomerase